MSSTPSIACIGIIGKHDNPLHITLFPPYTDSPSTSLEFSFLLNASLDLFQARARDPNRLDQDLGLLQVVNERLGIWGWETGTGTRFVVFVDRWGRRQGGIGGGEKGKEGVKGGGRVGEGDVRGAFRALQTAYIRLLQNPFYTPDDHTPMAATAAASSSSSSSAAGPGGGVVVVGAMRGAEGGKGAAAVGGKGAAGAGGIGVVGSGGEITSRRFVDEVRRIGERWRPGMGVV